MGSPIPSRCGHVIRSLALICKPLSCTGVEEGGGPRLDPHLRSLEVQWWPRAALGMHRSSGGIRGARVPATAMDGSYKLPLSPESTVTTTSRILCHPVTPSSQLSQSGPKADPDSVAPMLLSPSPNSLPNLQMCPRVAL